MLLVNMKKENEYLLGGLKQGKKCRFRCRFEPPDLRKVVMPMEFPTEKLWKWASKMPFSNADFHGKPTCRRKTERK